MCVVALMLHARGPQEKAKRELGTNARSFTKCGHRWAIGLSCSLVGSACVSQALLNHVHLWIKRVPSVENIADLPSREEYELLGRLHAEWIEPRVAQLFMD